MNIESSDNCSNNKKYYLDIFRLHFEMCIFLKSFSVNKLKGSVKQIQAKLKWNLRPGPLQPFVARRQ